MKYIIRSFVFIIFLLSISCSDDYTVLSAIEDGNELKNEANVPFLMEQNYPNPFNPSTNIQFSVYSQTPFHLRLNIYTEDWIRVDTILDENLGVGSYRVTFDAKDLPSGDYYYTLEGDGLVLTRKMKLLK